MFTKEELRYHSFFYPRHVYAALSEGIKTHVKDHKQARYYVQLREGYDELNNLLRAHMQPKDIDSVVFKLKKNEKIAHLALNYTQQKPHEQQQIDISEFRALFDTFSKTHYGAILFNFIEEMCEDLNDKAAFVFVVKE